MRVRIKHVTRYTYDEPSVLGPHVVRLTPAPHLASNVLTYNLDIEPKGCVVHWQLDPWANKVARVTFDDVNPIGELAITVDASFDLIPVNPFDFFLDERCRELPWDYPDGLEEELAPFLDASNVDPEVFSWLEGLPFEGYIVDYLVALNQKVADDINYIIRNEPGIQTPVQTLDKAKGSCRDSAWLLVAACRARGLAARFVSGYLIQLEDEGNIPGLPRGMDRDVLDLHAWAEVYLPGAGWVGLDGTSGLLTTEGHIPLAASVVPSLAAPVAGTTTIPSTGFDFSMEVERVGHEPRPRKPYTDEDYEALLDAGDAADARLAKQGVTLTVGGEPTWTSREHPREEEWITEAMGPTKWAQGLRMARELYERMADGGLGIYRFGKHYPGESLPRWALHLLWRPDGVPIWRDPSLLEFAPALPDATASGVEEAKEMTRAICEQIGVEPVAMPAYEDPWYVISTEGNLPDDVDPTEYDLDDSEARKRLAKILAHGVQEPVGFVTPVQQQMGKWKTQAWSFRRGKLYLIPGDSPIGLRLPLDRLPGEPHMTWTLDPNAAEPDLAFEPARRRVHQHAGDTVSVAGEPAKTRHVRTALCVQPRDGVLHVFIPPVPDPEAYLELIAAVEDAAASRGQKVRLEGYAPPRDARLESCLVTPDPGVIEVNIPVSTTARQYADLLETLGDAATHAGLCTERFQLDGRSVGSGGGNHITFGGRTPDESVFLNRPDVLASLVRFFQHHPSLSYLFTGLFVGSTSQAPRVDEARMEMLSELELALNQLDRAGDPPQPWFIDRLLRNLLIDVSGNAHRTEICIDKLFNPGSPTGRLGIVELRAFEMPPNEKMATAIVVLLRSLITAFIEEPYRGPLIRWGTALHDRFMLPYYLWQDLCGVLAFLRERGFDARESWFEPFVEYRFPRLGTLRAEGVAIDVRPGLEPWPVLGEEPTGATVSRYVDSSLERVEVRVRHLFDERLKIAVNGYQMPLVPTETPGEYVMGVKFRAWQPPHCLHPHIGIHHPLEFDVIDTWASRSVGGCQVHVWHPEGRGFDEPPLTAFEAAARRVSRFTTNSHMPYPAKTEAVKTRPETPYTLDLRWFPGDRPAPFYDPDVEDEE